MTISRIVKRSGRPAMSLAAAIALMTTVASTGSAAGAQKATGMKTRPAPARALADPAPQPKPVQLRYFGGPKSMMSAQ